MVLAMSTRSIGGGVGGGGGECAVEGGDGFGVESLARPAYDEGMFKVQGSGSPRGPGLGQRVDEQLPGFDPG